MRSLSALVLAIAPLLFVARADLELDNDDVPSACRSICRPISELTRRCDASDMFDDDDDAEEEYERNEDHLRAQCVCTNNSFDVANFASQCADCIAENFTDQGECDDDCRDGYEDVMEIISTCGFATTATFASTATAAAETISVSASAPTASSQLTTTIEAVNRPTGGANNNEQDDGADSFAVRGAVPLGGFSGYAVLCSFGALAAGAAAILL